MKPNYLQTSLLGLTTLVVASCAGPKMAQQTNVLDDVYAATAQARVYVPQEKPVVTDEAYQGDDYYGTSDPYYDMDYTSRINRFYYSSPWRTYYDNFYNYSYMPWYSPSYAFNMHWGSPFGYWNHGFNNWGFRFGNPYYWGGGYYGGGYYGGGGFLGGGGYWGGGIIGGTRVVANPNYGPRPNRGRDNSTIGAPATMGGLTPRPISGTPQGRTRIDQGIQGNPSRVGQTNDGRPTRGGTVNNTGTRTSQAPPAARPTRSETPPAQRPATYDRPSTPPPSSSGGGTRTESSGGGGGGRPGRG